MHRKHLIFLILLTWKVFIGTSASNQFQLSRDFLDSTPTFRPRSTDGGVFVTLATTSDFALGAMVLGFSLLKANTSHQIVCMVTPAVEAHVRTLLARVFDRIIEVGRCYFEQLFALVLGALKQIVPGAPSGGLRCANTSVRLLVKALCMDSD